MEYGFTKNGFVMKPHSVILEEERDAFRSKFGDDIDISDDSIAGKYIGNQAAKHFKLWELMEAAVSAGDVDAAKGIYLDRLAAFVNVKREKAIKTEVIACIWGEEGKTINEKSLIKLSSTGDIFYLEKAVTISRNKLIGFWIKAKNVDVNVNYLFQLKGATIEYTAGADDDEESVQEALGQKIEEVLPNLFKYENLGSDGLKIHVKDGVTPFDVNLTDENIDIAFLGAYGVFLSQNSGPVYAPIGTLCVPVTNIKADSVYNYATGITGRVVESDTELRVNMNKRQRQASGNEIAIRNAIRDKDNVPGVKYAEVYSNRTMEVVAGRPPKSYESVVVGGDDKAIANTIFNTGPAGVEPFGNTFVIIKDDEGFDWKIGFSRPVPQYVWMKIIHKKHVEETFPINGNDQIKDNIVKWSNETLDVGIDLIYQRFGIPVYAVPGIAEVDIKMARTTQLSTPPNESEYQSVNIPIGEVEIAVIDRGRIFVEEYAP